MFRRESQRFKKVCESFVPRVRVVEVTGVAGSFHHQHAVVAKVTQVVERQLSKLSVLVAVNDQRGDLQRATHFKSIISSHCASLIKHVHVLLTFYCLNKNRYHETCSGLLHVTNL